MKMTLAGLIMTYLISITSPAVSETISTKAGAEGTPIALSFKTGDHWKHTFMRVLHLYPIKTTPQIAVWIEDMNGNFLETLYVTKRYATQSWRKTPGENTPVEKIHRIEALPCWAYRHGSTYYIDPPVPEKSTLLPDAVTEASPKADFTLRSTIEADIDSVLVCVEINNSTDFNDYYRRDAHKGDSTYSGGRYGSGQPALVYGALIHPGNHNGKVQFTLLGHSSPDGSDGELYTGLDGITTARQIVEEITVTW